jgi:branched-chain amino acid transport system permease protein
MDQFLSVLIAGLLLGGIYGLVALGLNLIFGVVRIVNFAQGELVMLSMYLTYWLYTQLGITPYLALLVVAPVLFVAGLLLQRWVLQPLQNEPMMQIFATFGLVILFQNLVLGATGGQAMSVDWPFAREVVQIGAIKVNGARLITLAAVTVITIGLHLFLRDTMPGRAIRAVIQDQRAARAMGINVERTYRLTFGVGAALAGVAGALLTPIFTLSPWIGNNFVLAAFAVVVLGGLGSVWGAYIGGLLVGLVEAFAGFYIDPALRQAIWFLIFIAVLILRPAGLLGQVGAEEVGFRGQQ